MRAGTGPKVVQYWLYTKMRAAKVQIITEKVYYFLYPERKVHYFLT
jgi:hypothetical protein